MKVDLIELKEAARFRPRGYLDDFLSVGKIVNWPNGRQYLEVSKEDVLRLFKKYKKEKPIVRQLSEKRTESNDKTADQKKSICENCPGSPNIGQDSWYHPALKKCIFPNCGCPRSVSRIEPWINMNKCPVGHW